MERYVRWCREGHLSSTGKCFDIGNTTRAALSRFEKTGDPFAGSTEPNAVGNGSLMRLAPVAMFYASRPEEGIAACGESSRTAHGAREAVDACRFFGGLLIGAMNGVSKDELLSPMYSPVAGLWERQPRAEDRGGGGWVVRSAVAAADRGDGVCGEVARGGVVGVRDDGQLSGWVSGCGQSRGRRGYDGGHPRADRGGTLRQFGDPNDLARAVSPRFCTRSPRGIPQERAGPSVVNSSPVFVASGRSSGPPRLRVSALDGIVAGCQHTARPELRLVAGWLPDHAPSPGALTRMRDMEWHS
jgi:hypothetical protein